jgi:hypothetical protein
VIIINQCSHCRHYRKEVVVDKRAKGFCDAFPQGIPEVIFYNEHDHRSPFEGDQGIMFEPRSTWGDEQQREIFSRSYDEDEIDDGS